MEEHKEAECQEDQWNEMNFILTNHAKKRMFERNIKINQIQKAINFPDYTIKKENKIECHKKFKNKLLVIVYTKEGKFIKIITVIWK